MERHHAKKSRKRQKRIPNWLSKLKIRSHGSWQARISHYPSQSRWELEKNSITRIGKLLNDHVGGCSTNRMRISSWFGLIYVVIGTAVEFMYKHLIVCDYVTAAISMTIGSLHNDFGSLTYIYKSLSRSYPADTRSVFIIIALGTSRHYWARILFGANRLEKAHPKIARLLFKQYAGKYRFVTADRIHILTDKRNWG